MHRSVAALAIIAAWTWSGTAAGELRDQLLMLPSGDSPPVHLEPVDPVLSADLEELLGISAADCIATFMIAPAFTPELGICVELKWREDGKKEYFLSSVRPSENLYFARIAKRQPNIARHRRKVSVDFATAVDRAVGRAILQARYPAVPYRGVDGENGIFSAFVFPLGRSYGMYHLRPVGLPLMLRELAVELEQITSASTPWTYADEKRLLKRLSEIERLATGS